ncbi:hypothetical protein GGI03_003320 [Coemansia sp. RSA 2337]|nr:hypothetical protein GGI03_003320 [Coemansia sp. RSA 2337]
MCKEHCSAASAPETKRIIVTMKEGIDEKQKAAFIKDLEEKGCKISGKAGDINEFVAEAPAAVFKSIQISPSKGLTLTEDVTLDGSITLEVGYL